MEFMENFPTNWCKFNKKKSNFGLIWVVSGAPGGPTPHNFFFFWLEMLNYVPL